MNNNPTPDSGKRCEHYNAQRDNLGRYVWTTDGYNTYTTSPECPFCKPSTIKMSNLFTRKVELVKVKVDNRLLMQTIGANIKKIRKSKNMTQAELADSIDYSRPSIPNIEKGRQNFTIHYLYKMCVALGCEVSDILPKLK